MERVAPENAEPNQVGRFQPGRSGNPAGKPKGTRNRVTLAVEALLEGEAEAITRKAVELALQGDTVALRLCLDRIAPPRRGRPVSFEIGALETAADLSAASRRVLEAVAAGDLTPEEAQAVGAVIETARRAIETEELDRRLSVLESRA